MSDYTKKRRAPYGEARQFFNDTVLSCESVDCLVWPYAKTKKGYAVFTYAGSLRSVHRVACQIVHGCPPTDHHEAAHSCGNGTGGCVNPKHVRWATRQENAADRTLHGRTYSGERNGASKLTDEQARDIAALVADPSRQESYSSIAARYGVSIYPVYSIAKGIKWAATIAEARA